MRLIVFYICTGDLPVQDDDLNFEIDDLILQQLQTQVEENLTRQPLALTEIKAQCDYLEQLVVAGGSRKISTVPMSARFTWLMNVNIIFLASRSGTITRVLLEPISFPLQSACKYLNRRPILNVKIHELGNMVVEWARMLSGPCSTFEKGSSKGDPGTSRALPDLIEYLGVYASPLHPSVQPRLHPSYVDFHNRVVQFYPREVSAEMIKLESPFPPADVPAVPTRQKIHELENGLRVKEFSPMGLDDEQIGQSGRLVWYAGGRYQPICVG